MCGTCFNDKVIIFRRRNKLVTGTVSNHNPIKNIISFILIFLLTGLTKTRVFISSEDDELVLEARVSC